MPLLSTSNILREGSFSCPCLKPFTFETVRDMSPNTWGRAGAHFTKQPVFYGVGPQIKLPRPPTDHVAHTQAELGWLVWARMQTCLLNFHNWFPFTFGI